MRNMVDKTKSLKYLENKDLDMPKFASSLAQKCERLWSVPLSEFSNEDIRLLIGQKISLKFLIPIALDILEIDPLAEGDLYRGDLLHSVLTVPNDFWLGFPALNNRLVEVKMEVESLEETITKEIIPLLKVFNYK